VYEEHVAAAVRHRSGARQPRRSEEGGAGDRRRREGRRVSSCLYVLPVNKGKDGGPPVPRTQGAHHHQSTNSYEKQICSGMTNVRARVSLPPRLAGRNDGRTRRSILTASFLPAVHQI